jgi:hypothetical protein
MRRAAGVFALGAAAAGNHGVGPESVRMPNDGGRARRMVVAALLLAAPLAPPAHADKITVSWTTMVPAGDFDGDGVADIALSVPRVGPDAISAVSGATGDTLWSVPQLGPQDISPIRLGSTGPGILFTEDVYGDSIGVLDRRGTLLWQRVWPDGVASFLVGDFLPGGGDDLFVVRHVDSGDGAGVRSAEVVDGTSGRTVSALGPMALPWWDAPPQAVGDLDGDGAADVVWSEPRDAGGDVLRAYAGDGRLLWENDDLAFVTMDGVTPVGDLTGDGRPDFTVWSEERAPQWRETTLVSGADGRALWTRPGTETLRVGDMNGDHRADLVLAEHTFVDERYGLTLRGYDAGGRLLYRRAAPFVDVEPAGDVDADGVTDLHAVWLDSEEDPDDPYQGPREGFVAGRTGRVLRTNPTAREYTLRASVDCRGADTTTVAYGPETAVVRALDGRTTRTLWSVTVPLEPGYPDVQVTALPRIAGRCADVLVASSGGYTARVEPSGRIRWQLGEPPS